MFLPYRAKNPPEHFPFITIGLIVINTLIFALTSVSFLEVREDVVLNYAVSHETFSPFRLVTAMFLHANLFHLAGNMLFLWIFGGPVEGRMRPPKYLLMYLLAGLSGGLLHEAVVGALYPAQFALGASGAIMGVAGAYVYMFPYSLICIFSRWGVTEWEARWVVLLYIGMDLLGAFAFKGQDGVGHFAHLGGFAVGLLAVFALRTRRDTEEASAAQAMRSELKDFSLLGYHELHALMQNPTDDMRLVTAFCEKALNSPGGNRAGECLAILRQHIACLLQQGDPYQLANLLLRIPPAAGGVPPMYYMRLASRLETASSNELAAQLYRRVYDLFPNAPDTETALYRLARLMERVYLNRTQARAIYGEMLRLFPNGQMALDARREMQRL